MTKIWECPNCKHSGYGWDGDAEYCYCTKCKSMFLEPDFFYHEQVTAKMIEEYREKYGVGLMDAKRTLIQKSYDKRGK